MSVSKDIKYLLEQEQRKVESKIKKLTYLSKKLNITDGDKLKEILEFADLFNECDGNGWFELKQLFTEEK